MLGVGAEVQKYVTGALTRRASQSDLEDDTLCVRGKRNSHVMMMVMVLEMTERMK